MRRIAKHLMIISKSVMPEESKRVELQLELFSETMREAREQGRASWK